MEKINLSEVLKALEKINTWFDEQEELDVEIGLQKVKEGMALVKASRSRLAEIENEFEEIKKEMQEEKK
jgi:exonuclease VII small subunit